CGVARNTACTAGSAIASARSVDRRKPCWPAKARTSSGSLLTPWTKRRRSLLPCTAVTSDLPQRPSPMTAASIILPMSSNRGDMATASKGTAMAKQTVGVIGLGLMGEVLATRLMAAGFGVMGYDIDPAKNARLTARGGKAAASPAEVAVCRVTALAVFSTDQVEDVVERALLPAVAAGTVVLCTSTCDPDRIEALGVRLAGTNIRFLETPVSGTS